MSTFFRIEGRRIGVRGGKELSRCLLSRLFLTDLNHFGRHALLYQNGRPSRLAACMVKSAMNFWPSPAADTVHVRPL